MSARDAAFDALRRARPADLPDAVAGPRSPGMQALLDDILATPRDGGAVPARLAQRRNGSDEPVALTHHGHDGDDDPRPVDILASRRRGRRRRLVAVGVAAAVVAVLAGVGVLVLDGRDGGDDGRVRTAGEDGRQPTRSGRVQVHWELDWEMVTAPIGRDTTYEFSGDALRVVGVDTPQSEYVEVDGSAWSYGPDYEALAESSGTREGVSFDDMPHVWQETEPWDMPGPADLDPATLLDRFAAAGPFEPVGEDEVDGIPVTRQRAMRPDQASFEAVGQEGFYSDGTVTAVDAWVDAAGRVLRIDLTRDGTEQGQPFRETYSLTFTDIGEAITITPPDPDDVVRTSDDDDRRSDSTVG